MLGENSNSPELIKQDKLDAKLIREKYPVAFEKPTNEQIFKMGKKGEIEIVLPESLPYSKGVIKIKRDLIGKKIIVTPDKNGRVVIPKHYFNEVSYQESGIGKHLLVPKNSFTTS